MRYTIFDLQNEIVQIDKNIQDALEVEERIQSQIDWGRFDIDRGERQGADGWDRWEADRAASYLPEDIKYLQKQKHVRLRLEKNKRILLIRIKKIQDLQNSENND